MVFCTVCLIWGRLRSYDEMVQFCIWLRDAFIYVLYLVNVIETNGMDTVFTHLVKSQLRIHLPTVGPLVSLSFPIPHASPTMPTHPVLPPQHLPHRARTSQP
jgi:hypothetical protein